MQHTILVVEDNEAIRRLLLLALEPDYHVLLTTDGLEALQLLSTMYPCRPSLILLDWRMPHMTGGELLARLHELGYAQRVVVLSAMPRLEREALAAGARRFLSKPFDLDKLLEVVEELTDSPSAKMEAVSA